MLQDVVNVQISRETATITRAGFGTAMILGTHTNFAENIKFYSSIDEVSGDFATTDPEYKAAAKLFAADIKPSRIAIGKRAADVAQVEQVDIDTVVDNTDYTVTINGNEYTYGSGAGATATAIRDGLIAAITAGSDPVTATDVDADSFSITGDEAGEAFTLAVGANLSTSTTTEVKNVSTFLQTIQNENSDWYALALTSRDKADILRAASWIESQRKIFLACTDDADVITSATSDVASELASKSYARTGLLYSEDQANFPEARWLGEMLPKDPGSATWALKSLSGISVDALSSTAIANLKTKKANYYISVLGVGVTQGANGGGVVAEGEFLDIIRGIDWLQARMGEELFTLFVTEDKIPYTVQGIDQVTNPMRQVLDLAIVRGILSSYEITTPELDAVLSADKAARTLKDVKFSGVLQGAIHSVEITGSVSVG